MDSYHTGLFAHTSKTYSEYKHTTRIHSNTVLTDSKKHKHATGTPVQVLTFIRSIVGGWGILSKSTYTTHNKHTTHIMCLYQYTCTVYNYVHVWRVSGDVEKETGATDT
jgi:hypothetical protein